MNDSIQQQALSLPERPGVYLFKDEAGGLLYVGKAQNLKKRVKSYLRPVSRLGPRTARLMDAAHVLEWITVDTPHEALILEADLVRRDQPRYNVLLRDDKRFPWLKLGMREPYPTLRVVRHRVRDGALYFGPYTSARAMRQVLQLIRQYYPLRKCRQDVLSGQRTDKGPCLYKQLGQCLAPCEGDLDPAVYRRVVEEVKEILVGRIAGLAERAREDMRICAGKQCYEDAARYRDKMSDLLQVAEKAATVTGGPEDEDILGVAFLGDEAVVLALKLREGKLAGHEDMFLENAEGASLQEILEAYLLQRYGEGTLIPTRISLPVSLESSEEMEKALTHRAGRLVTLSVPRSGDRLKLLAMAERNARLRLSQKSLLDAAKTLPEGRLNEMLGLSDPLTILDAVDVANWGDSLIVGSVVRVEEGRLFKGGYRKFTVKNRSGRDDYASMRQIVFRHLRQIIRRSESLPHLLLVDGGEGHRQAVLEVIEKEKLSIPVIALAKKEEILLGPKKGQRQKLEATEPGARVLIAARDEAHRFAQAHLHLLASKSTQESVLDLIPSIGRSRKEALMKAFGSVEALRSASLEDIRKVQGIGPALAEQIKAHLGSGA